MEQQDPGAPSGPGAAQAVDPEVDRILGLMENQGTHYQILGVPPGAGASEIRRAYMRLARVCHPDRNSEANRDAAKRAFQRLSEAYQTLSDENRRIIYDAELRDRAAARPPEQRPGRGNTSRRHGAPPGPSAPRREQWPGGNRNWQPTPGAFGNPNWFELVLEGLREYSRKQGAPTPSPGDIDTARHELNHIHFTQKSPWSHVKSVFSDVTGIHWNRGDAATRGQLALIGVRLEWQLQALYDADTFIKQYENQLQTTQMQSQVRAFRRSNLLPRPVRTYAEFCTMGGEKYGSYADDLLSRYGYQAEDFRRV